MEGGHSNTVEVMIDSGMYNLQFNGESPGSILEFICTKLIILMNEGR